ncbi:hypothetical protein INR76_11215 [Marixanthomonas sp. SCSIO 43207]|uniref:hypothetical protein n=1 Tax=Marixanthomonas sp. SCSIO 43207 TaxID=2779360 RepID=UPI001CA9E701|nr:hypothetical protein [Marixanthomonas sp. SCSIO 43207]UAB80674.1 hypothetical protein INR76_11215 [Marixanthomonas sp. SCSIO 43207]
MKHLKYLFLGVLIMGLYSCSDDDPVISDDDNDTPQTVLARLFVTSNTSDIITELDFVAGTGIVPKNFTTGSNDNEGIFYDKENDFLVQASRSQSVLNSYSNIESTEGGSTLNLQFSSNPVLESPRDLAVNNEFYVVSDNANDNGRFFVFTKDDTSFTLRNTITVNFPVWGIEFIGDDLYVVVDKSSDIAVFNNFLSATSDNTLEPNKRITIEGINRTHGIAYDDGTLVLTDIGDAENDSDGGFQVISNFQSKFDIVENGGTLGLIGDQVRVSGSFTKLGNPISVEYDKETRSIFIAERANEGGKILIFDTIEAGGNLTPSFEINLEGASSLHFVDND